MIKMINSKLYFPIIIFLGAISRIVSIEYFGDTYIDNEWGVILFNLENNSIPEAKLGSSMNSQYASSTTNKISLLSLFLNSNISSCVKKFSITPDLADKSNIQIFTCGKLAVCHN